MKEYDIVTAKSKLNDKVMAGFEGTILEILDKDIYLVEFFDNEGDNVDIAVVKKNEIRPGFDPH